MTHRVTSMLLALTLALSLTACKDGKPMFGKPKPPPPGMALIPAGPFTMGTDETDAEGRGDDLGLMIGWFDSAHPAHQVDLPAFYMDIHEVSNADYAAFIAATGWAPPNHWRGQKTPPEGLENHPVTHVTWFDSRDYCQWAGRKFLPSEQQWEKAARGTEGRTYPWGENYQHHIVIVARNNTSPVGSFPENASPYGILDLTGNVWEWTTSWYKGYPGSTWKDDKYGQERKVLRGNSWASIGHYPDPDDFNTIVANNSRTTYRLYLTPKGRLNDVGFRCVKPA